MKQHTEQNILNYKKYNNKEDLKSIIVDSEGTTHKKSQIFYELLSQKEKL
jgi:hypothetical protein